MQRDHYRKGSPEERGTWSPIVQEIDGRHLVIGALVRCKQCGFERTIHHEVLDTGEINPEFVCPAELCKYKARIVLDEWTGGNLPASTV